MNVGEVLVHILIVLLAAKLAAEAAERLNVPAVVGEILAGVLIGPSALGLVGQDDVLRVLGQLGVILLLLQVGLEMDLTELVAVGRASVLVASTGVVVPLVLGFGIAEAFGHDANTALFVGAALTATSVGITARVFGDLKALASPEARIVLGAAVADDVMGLVILTVVVRIVSAGTVSVATVTWIVLVALAFLVVGGLAGVRLAPPLFGLVDRFSRASGTLVALALAFTLGFAKVAQGAKLAPIVGAFVAGLALGRSAQSERIRRELTPVGHLFIPVFFLQIGIDARLSEFARPAVLGLAGALLAAAVVGKLVSPLGAIGSPGDKTLIGIGMIPRGEVGLIFATLGLQNKILGQNLYASILLVVLVTTLVTPPLLRWRLLRIKRQPTVARPVVPTPPQGWFDIRDGIFDLAGDPPTHLALHLALQAALLAADRRPGPRLLDWLASVPPGPLPWDPGATEEFFAVLRGGSVRSWRFLEATGVLDRAVPELAEAAKSRRDDPFELDPTHPLRWQLVDRIRELPGRDQVAAGEFPELAHPEWLLLAALVLETAGGDAAPVASARRLVQRLDLGAAAEEEIALLVGGSGLLRAAIRRWDVSEQAVLQIAAHLDRPERARALYLLTLAQDEFDRLERARLDELYRLVQETLARPELTGLEARNLLQRRRAEAIRLANATPDSQPGKRIEQAPRTFALGETPAQLASAVVLVDPLPPLGHPRVEVTPLPSEDRWRVAVVARDRPGLLAAVAAVLAQIGQSVTRAVAATWPDGGTLVSLEGGGPEPRAEQVLGRLRAGSPPPPTPIIDARLEVDNDASPWYSLCTVRAGDRPGLLAAIAAALFAGGAEVHTARVETVADEAIDTFELTDRYGQKLTTEGVDQLRSTLVAGSNGKSSRRWARTKLIWN
ncbi:MAG TPA: cation:proton antiporter [Acidimicrobiales bacterium]|nr:cation:proton antiporter [Acidimicrobiales bacterium]